MRKMYVFLRIDHLLFVFSSDRLKKKQIHIVYVYLIINQISILRNMHSNVHYKYT